MSNTEILFKLRDLHEELASINDDLKSAERVDESTIDVLGQLVTDVGVLVDRARQINDPDSNPEEGHRLVDRIEKFESDHPSVTRFLSQVTDVLGMMGI